MKRLIFIVFLAGISPCLWAQSKELKIKELLAGFAKQEKFNISVHTAPTKGTSGPERGPESPGENNFCRPTSIKITIEDGKLVTQDSVKPNAPPVAQNQDYYSLKVDDADIEFTRDEAGIITLVIRLPEQVK